MTSREVLTILKEEKLYLSNNNTNEVINAIERDTEVLECFQKYFDFEIIFGKNQTFLIFKSKERYLPIDYKLPISNKYYEPLKEWLKDE